MSGPLVDEERQERDREREQLDRRQQDKDLRAVLATPEGRRVVWRVLAGWTSTFSASYAGDALATSYNEGRRAVGLELMTQAQRVAPAEYLQMLQERMEQQREKTQRSPEP